MTGDEETEDNGDKIDNDLPNDVCGTLNFKQTFFRAMMAILILTKVKKKSVELLEKVQKSKIVSRK